MDYLSNSRRKGRNVNSFLAFLLFVCMSVMPVMAQQDKNVTLNVKNETVENVLKSLGQQTGLKFFYDQNVVNVSPRVTLQASGASLQSVLNQISSQTQLSFNRNNNTITVGTLKAGGTDNQKKMKVTGVVVDANGEPIIGHQIDVPCRFGVQYEVMDVTSSRVQGFIEDVLDEIITIFPSPVIHIGGDEVKFDQWNASTSIQEYMIRQGIETPADLQIVFTNRISHLLQQKERRMMGWNDITGNKIHEYNTETDATAKEKLADGTIVQFWKGDLDLIEKTASQGYDIVNSYHYKTYLDYDYQKIPLEKAYEFDPVPEGLPEDLKKKILGLGCQMWGEEIMDNDKMYYQIFPRIAAYAECGWTLSGRKDYFSFLKPLEKLKIVWRTQGLMK